MTDTYRECMAKIADAAYSYLDDEGDITIEQQLNRDPKCAEWFRAAEAADHCYSVAFPVGLI